MLEALYQVAQTPNVLPISGWLKGGAERRR